VNFNGERNERGGGGDPGLGGVKIGEISDRPSNSKPGRENKEEMGLPVLSVLSSPGTLTVTSHLQPTRGGDTFWEKKL